MRAAGGCGLPWGAPRPLRCASRLRARRPRGREQLPPAPSPSRPRPLPPPLTSPPSPPFPSFPRPRALASSLLASLSPLNAHFGWGKKTTWSQVAINFRGSRSSGGGGTRGTSRRLGSPTPARPPWEPFLGSGPHSTATAAPNAHAWVSSAPLLSPLSLLLFYLRLSLFFGIDPNFFITPTPGAPGWGCSVPLSWAPGGPGLPIPFSRERRRLRRGGPVEWGRARGTGDLEMPFVLSQAVGTLTHLPNRPWLNKLLQVISVTPLGRGKGRRRDRRGLTGKGRASLCAPEPGWQKGAPEPESAGGVETFPRGIASKLSILARSISACLRPRPCGRLGAAADADLGSFGNFFIPGTSRGVWKPRHTAFPALAGCSETGPEGTPGLNLSVEMGWRPGEVLPSLPDRDVTGVASGSPSCGPDPSRAAFSERSLPRLPGGGASIWAGPAPGEGQCRQVAGPGGDTHAPGKFTEQDSWDDRRRPRGTEGSCWRFWPGPPLGRCKFHLQVSTTG